MNHLARHSDPSSVTAEVGIVARVDGAEIVVKGGAGEYLARRAAHCLVAPEEGDLVMVASMSNGRRFVAGILERAASTPPVVSSDEGLAVRLKGRLDLKVDDGIGIATAKALEIAAGALDLHAIHGSAVFERLTVLSGFVHAEVDRLKAFAASVDSVIDRVTERVKRVYRFVEESEHVRAERLDYVAEKTMSLHAENTVVTAEDLVKIDGEQIHVG